MTAQLFLAGRYSSAVVSIGQGFLLRQLRPAFYSNGHGSFELIQFKELSKQANETCLRSAT
jgi:hypothetical protein